MNSGLFKNSIVYLLILLAVAALIFSIFSNPRESNQLDITTVAEQIKAGEVASLSVDGEDVTVEYTQSSKPNAKSRKETGVSIFKTLEELGVSQEELSAVEIKVVPPGVWSDWGTLAITIQGVDHVISMSQTTRAEKLLIAQVSDAPDAE